MTRVLLIDADGRLTESVAMRCLEDGIAVRIAGTFCEGVRHLLETPVSLIILSSALVRLPGAKLAQLLDSVAPGVPVVLRVDADQGIEEEVRFELHGFRVVREPFDVVDLVSKAEARVRVRMYRPSTAAAAVEAACR